MPLISAVVGYICIMEAPVHQEHHVMGIPIHVQSPSPTELIYGDCSEETKLLRYFRDNALKNPRRSGNNQTLL